MPATTMVWLKRSQQKSSRKSEMQAWLRNHNILFADSDLKADLIGQTLASQISTVYLTDVETEAQGYEVVCLSVALCALNPIELAWANVKEYIRKHNKQFTVSEIEMLTPGGTRETYH